MEIATPKPCQSLRLAKPGRPAQATLPNFDKNIQQQTTAQRLFKTVNQVTLKANTNDQLPEGEQSWKKVRIPTKAMRTRPPTSWKQNPLCLLFWAEVNTPAAVCTIMELLKISVHTRVFLTPPPPPPAGQLRRKNSGPHVDSTQSVSVIDPLSLQKTLFCNHERFRGTIRHLGVNAFPIVQVHDTVTILSLAEYDTNTVNTCDNFPTVTVSKFTDLYSLPFIVTPILIVRLSLTGSFSTGAALDVRGAEWSYDLSSWVTSLYYVMLWLLLWAKSDGPKPRKIKKQPNNICHKSRFCLISVIRHFIAFVRFGIKMKIIQGSLLRQVHQWPINQRRVQ